MMPGVHKPAVAQSCFQFASRHNSSLLWRFHQRVQWLRAAHDHSRNETYFENTYSDVPSCVVIFRKLVNGAENDVEQVVALRSHPLQMEFHQRNVAEDSGYDGMCRNRSLELCEAFV